MKKVISISFLALFLLPALPAIFVGAGLAPALSAQTKKVAMLEPVGKATDMQKRIIRASLAEAITNSGGYEALTRTDIDQIMKEHNFQTGGMVSDAQRKRLGQMSGAELLCIIHLTVDGTDFFVESEFVEMESGRIYKTALLSGKALKVLFIDVTI